MSPYTVAKHLSKVIAVAAFIAAAVVVLLVMSLIVAGTIVWCIADELWRKAFVVRLALRMLCFAFGLVIALGELIKLATMPVGFSPQMWGVVALFCGGLLLGWNDKREPRVNDKGDLT